MVSFIAALYNEEDEIDDLIEHVRHDVDHIYLADDVSTDLTTTRILGYVLYDPDLNLDFTVLDEHSGLPETVKAEALELVPDGDWVIMLDADERFITPLSEIVTWIKSPASEEIDYVYCEQYEIIDDQHVRTFQKCKIFRKESITFGANDIHKDDQFEGNGAFFGWKVAHRKTSYKQIKREQEYLETYKKLLDEGHIDEGRYNWLVGLHHYVKP